MYKTVNMEELSKLDPEYKDEGFDDDYRLAIVRLKEDGSLDYVCRFDGGEPEDNSFGRDGAWIVGELNRALNEK